MPPDADSLPLGEILLGLASGLGFFLFGLDQMTQALKAVAGDKLRRLLAKLTVNRWAGALTGAGVTAAVNSSSITTVLLVGFISAGVMSLEQAVPVIMGANIGSTATAQIVAFNVMRWGVPLAAAGFFLLFMFRKRAAGIAGNILLGLGLIFFGMSLMSDGAYPLRDYQPFIEMMENLRAPALGILAGALFTALVQSSAATTGIVIVLAGQGVISLEAGIAIAYGANIGTCATALLAAIGKPREAVQAAIVHLLFNVGGVLAFAFFIPELATLARAISPDAADLEGMARQAAEVPREIANAHTLFNVGATALFIGFTGAFARLVRWLVPARPESSDDLARPRHIDPVYLKSPDAALEQARWEMLRLAEHAIEQTERAGQRFLGETEENPPASDALPRLHRAIVDYLARLAAEDLQPAQSRALNDYVTTANYWDAVAEIATGPLAELARQRVAEGATLSETRQAELSELFARVTALLRQAREALAREDPALAGQVIDAQPDIRQRLKVARQHLQDNLGRRDAARLGVYLLENDFVEANKQLYSLAKRLARLRASA